MPTVHPTRANSKREAKTERLEVRLSPLAKQTIQRATALSGLTVGDLAYEAALRILEDHERMLLRAADRDAFLSALQTPARPTKRLASAIRRHRNSSSK